MDLAIRFNETGVELYESGNAPEAFEMFHASLQVMLRSSGKTMADMDPLSCQLLAFQGAIQRALGKDELFRQCHVMEQAPMNISRNLSNSLSDADCGSVSTGCLDSDSSHRSGSERQQRLRSKMDQENPCLYTSAYYIPKNYVQYDSHQYIVAVATDLYNLALILHRGHVVDRLSGCLERSLILYTYAGELLWNHLGYNLLQKPKPPQQAHDHNHHRYHDAGDASLSHLYCAILNNTGYLLHQMGYYDWSQLFFERLYQFLELLGPASEEQERRERDDFQLNVVVLYKTLTAAAAA